MYYHHHCKGETDEEITIFILYVDGSLILGSSKAVLTGMIDYLGNEFEVRSLPVDCYVGVDINRNGERRIAA